VGFGLAICVGVPLGLVIGRFRAAGLAFGNGATTAKTSNGTPKMLL
jgi:ABC-type nitrate/sulfonate/bicarbonate transport system permease component